MISQEQSASALINNSDRNLRRSSREYSQESQHEEHQQLQQHPKEQLERPVKNQEKIYQADYDQWYNQKVPPQLGGNYYQNNNRVDLQSQWTQGQSVENYENIQVSSDFVNSEVVSAPETPERDIYGSRDSINRETLDNEQHSRQPTTENSNIELSFVQMQQPIQLEQVST